MKPAEFKVIGDKGYVILPDGSMARKLKPTIINGVPHWNLSIGGGKTKRITIQTVQNYLDALTSRKEEKPH
jgi:hypothetical protein